MKQFGNSQSLPLMSLINLSFLTGKFSWLLKVAKVIWIHKNCNKRAIVLGPLLFLIFINDLYNSAKKSTAYHLADDTNLLYTNNSLEKINKLVKIDIALIANKISLNTSKTETILFRCKRKTISKHLNFWISGQNANLSKNIRVS